MLDYVMVRFEMTVNERRTRAHGAVQGRIRRRKTTPPAAAPSLGRLAETRWHYVGVLRRRQIMYSWFTEMRRR